MMGLFQYLWQYGPAVGPLKSQNKHLSFSAASSHKPSIFPDTASVFAETAGCGSVRNGCREGLHNVQAKPLKGERISDRGNK